MSSDIRLDKEEEDTTFEYDGEDSVARPAQTVSRTLLPGPVASTVSAVTGVTALGWKVTSKVGGWWITAARETTLTSLEITRLATEAVLRTVSRDVSRRTQTDLGRAEAEGILERTVSAFHATISTVSIFAASGFYATAAGLDSVSALSIHGLATLNAILGSTETSRAVAAIITLVRNELKKGDSASTPHQIGYFDLAAGTVVFVLLQRWGRRKTEIDFRESGGEETIWDTVIDDKGFRADVVATRTEPSALKGSGGLPGQIALVSAGGDEQIDAVERATLHETTSVQLSPLDQTLLSDDEIRDQIMRQLPPGTHAQISTDTLMAKTIKVDIYNSETMQIDAPSGTVMIAESLNQPSTSHSPGESDVPRQTVIFRSALKRISSIKIDPIDVQAGPRSQNPTEAEDDEDVVMMSSPVDLQDDAEDRTSNAPAVIIPQMVDSWDSQPSSLAPLANQKRSRRPPPRTAKSTSGAKAPQSGRPQTSSKPKHEPRTKSEKDGPFKKALKSLSPSASSTAIKDQGSSSVQSAKKGNVNALSAGAIARMTSLPTKIPSLKPLPARPTNKSEGLTADHIAALDTRTESPNTYFTVHESRRNSMVSQTDTYSLHSVESRPGSPNFARTHARNTSELTQAKSEVNISVHHANGEHAPSERHHRRSRSFVPSLYSLTTGKSNENIIVAPKTPLPRMSIYEDHQLLTALVTDGKVPKMFPKDQHLVRIVRRFARFSSASYGSNFLRVMGLSSPEKRISETTEVMKLDQHHEHSSFSKYTGLPAETILLSSYYDFAGVSGNSEWSPSTISPLIHFVSIDQESKAVVLTCRGTLGFEDVLTDMTCDFDELSWQGQRYKVHKGVHAAARRMLGATGSRMMATIKGCLEEFPGFGLVFCGHSLGGAVAALLAILIAEPSTDKSAETAFVTTKTQQFLTDGSTSSEKILVPVSLPAGRPIHVYAYGPPATCSEELRVATRGLITTVVNHADVVPSLSIGMLHDCRSVAVNLKNDTSGAVQQLMSRVFERLSNAIKSAFYVDQLPPIENMAGMDLGEDTRAWTALARLRMAMTNEKLVPPGEVFVVETTRVFDRQQYMPMASSGDTATERVYRSLGRPATRIQFKLIRRVPERFGELRFGRNMFSDHSPGRYESNLAALERGILEM